jgi:hypothetical protein
METTFGLAVVAVAVVDGGRGWEALEALPLNRLVARVAKEDGLL